MEDDLGRPVRPKPVVDLHTGYRDVTLLCRRRLGEGVFVVEVQFCLAELLDIEKRYASHKVYEEFRDYFGGADDAAVSKRVAVVDALG